MVLLDNSQQEQLKQIVAQLRQVRQEKEIRIEEIAANTRIRPAFLQALDEERFEDLPEPVYVQGFIRRYGDAIGIDGAALAQSFAITFAPPHLKEEPENTTRRPNIHVPLAIPYILLMAGATFGLFYILNPHPTAQSRNQVQFSPSASRPKTLSTPFASTINTTTTNQSIQPLSPNSALTASPAGQQPSPVEVTLKLQDKSWLRIRSDGKIVFQGILNKGEQRTWTAKKDLTIRSGNAGAVLVSENKNEPKPLGTIGSIKQVSYTLKKEQGSVKK